MKLYFDKLKHLKIEQIAYFFWGIYVLVSLLNMVGIFYASDECQLVFKFIRYICYGGFLAKIVIDWKNGEKITISIIVTFLLAIAIAIFAKNRTILFVVIILSALRKMNFDKLIEIALKIYMVGFLFVVCLALLNIIPNWEFSRGNMPRYALGFIYATDAIGVYLAIILMFMYIKKDKATYIELLVLELINVFMYSYTNGRLSFILISTMIFIQLASKFQFVKNIFYSNFVQKCLKIVCHTLPIVLFLGLHILVVMYANNNFIANKVNKIISDRIKLTYQAYRNNDVNLFGNDIRWQGWGAYGYKELEEGEEFVYNFVDSSYARLILDCGIIFSCVVIYAYRETLIKSYEEKNYWLIFAIMFILVWSFIEQYIININKNLFILSFIPLLEMGEIKQLSYSNISKAFKK